MASHQSKISRAARGRAFGLTRGLVLFLLLCAAAQAGPRAEGAKELKKAADALARLRPLAVAAGADADLRDYQELVAKAFPGVRVRIAGLPDGDLKTRLATAADFYFEASEPGGDAEAGQADRARSRRLWAEAGRQLKWAEALVRAGGGEAGPEISAAVAEMRATQVGEAERAGRVMKELRRVAEMVSVYESRGEFEGSGSLASVTFERFAAEWRRALREVDPALAALPRDRTYYLLRGARNAFRDGAFWWGRARPSDPRPATVAAHALAQGDPLAAMRLDRGSVAYVVVSNWRAGVRLLRSAEAMRDKVVSGQS